MVVLTATAPNASGLSRRLHVMMVMVMMAMMEMQKPLRIFARHKNGQDTGRCVGLGTDGR